MSFFLESVRSALTAIHTNFMRSVLTTLGIIIGVASVIVMVAVGEGARKDVEDKISSLGANILQLRPGSSRVKGRSIGAESNLPFSERDIVEIRNLVPSAVAVSGHLRRSGTVVNRDVNWLTNIDGVHASYTEVRDWEVANGRFFGEEEYETGAKVAVLGATAASSLFRDENPVGTRVRIADLPFEIVGVLESKGANPSGRDLDDVVLIPLSTARSRLVKRHKLVPDQVGYVSVKVLDEQSIPEAKKDIEELLGRLRGRIGKYSDAFDIRDLTEYLNAKTATQRTLGLLLAAAAAISLVVGGIGIMNIMLVSVTERTREIGLRMALGARRRDIRLQFLIEAIVLCLIGGIVGTIVGVGTAIAIAEHAEWPVLIAPYVVAMALSAAAVTGICFGFLPAQRAARLNPIEALRSE